MEIDRRAFATITAGAAALGAIGLPAIARPALAPNWPDATWIGDYAGQDCITLAGDPRFLPLLKGMFPKIRCPFLGCYVGIARIMPACLLVNGEVHFVNGRYAVLTGALLTSPNLRSLVWMDTQPSADGRGPVAIAAFLRPQPTGPRGRRMNLWILSNREPQQLDLPGVPRNFKVSFRRWLRQGSVLTEGRIVKLNWVSRSLHIQAIPPSFIHVPMARLHRAV